MLKFSIITPTLQRASLIRCCKSLEEQSFQNWEHIVQIDAPEMNDELIFGLAHPNRQFNLCGVHHNNFGNTCRHLAWERTTGDYVIHCDDDNFFTRPDALADIDRYLVQGPPWAVFPILRFQHRFFYDNPSSCYVDTANMVIKREIAQWPDGPEYTMDGIFCDYLRSKYAFIPFRDVEPIITVPVQSKGE